MATERQRRLYEAMEKQAFPSTENLASPRREASDLSAKLDVEVFSYDSTPSRHNQNKKAGRDLVEQNEARRRRIYENAYNRPYPSSSTSTKRRMMQLWSCGTSTNETTSLAGGGASITSSRAFLKKKPVVSPEPETPETASSSSSLPTEKVHQDWLCNNVVCGDEDDFLMNLDDDGNNNNNNGPDDEIEENMTPRKLWTAAVATATACGGGGGGGEGGGVVPVIEIMICTPPKTQRSVSFSSESQFTSAVVDSNSNNEELLLLTDTPDRSAMAKGEGGVSPLLSTSVKGSGPAPIVAPIIEKQLQRKPSGMQLAKEHRQNESYRALHKFLQTPKAAGETLKLYIDEYQVSTFDRIVESFFGNTSLKSLVISRSKEGTSIGSTPKMARTIAEMTCLFEAIRCLPYLETLVVWNAHAEILPALVENLPTSLTKLCLQVVDNGSAISNNILDAIAQKPNLQHVQLETRESMELGRLVNSSSIKSLRICGLWYDMDLHHMQRFADSLYSNLDSPLTELDIQPTLDLSSWKSLATALRFNTRVRTLKLSFMGESMAERDAAAAELAELLHSNTTLRTISNYTHDAVTISSDLGNGMVLEALQANTQLHKFLFFHEESVFWVAKHALLKRNQQVFGEEGDLSHTIYSQYVSFASTLPALKSKMCGEC
jgi:hypothetical protein